MIYVTENNFPFLNASERNSLQHLINQKNNEITQDDIIHYMSCDMQTAIAIIAALQTMEVAQGLTRSFHDCDHTTPALVSTMSEGFPKTPFDCPLCGQKINTLEELDYEMVARINKNC